MAQLGPAKHTRPERAFRMALVRARIRHKLHIRWGPHNRWVADFIVRGAIVDVHGSHWHGHRSKMRTMSAYWRAKIAANRARDRRKRRFAKANGLRYIVIWDREVSGAIDLERLMRRGSS